MLKFLPLAKLFHKASLNQTITFSQASFARAARHQHKLKSTQVNESKDQQSNTSSREERGGRFSKTRQQQQPENDFKERSQAKSTQTQMAETNSKDVKFKVEVPKIKVEKYEAPTIVKGGIEMLDPKKSKYGLSREEKNQKLQENRQKAPDYLRNDQMYKDFTKKDYEMENPIEIKERVKEQKMLEESKRPSSTDKLGFQPKPKKSTQKQISMDPIAKKVAISEHERRLQTFDRFNEEFVTAYISEKSQKKIRVINKENESPLDNFVNVSNIDEFQKPERVSKRLARMGICSRRTAEKLIDQRMVKVDGKVIDQNMQVSNQNIVQIAAKTGIYTPVKENTRIWLYHKPRGMVTTHADTHGRKTVFQDLFNSGLKIPHVISVGRLDFLSEGLMIITNDGEMARALEMPSYALERSYRVRVFGRMFNEDKLRRIKAGMMMGGQMYGPYICELEKRQTTNTWLFMKLFQGKNNEIRRVMRKLSLRVNRLIRTSYGPYTLGQVPNPGDIQEVTVSQDIRKILFKYYQDRTRGAQAKMNDAENEKTRMQNQIVDRIIGSENNKGDIKMPHQQSEKVYLQESSKDNFDEEDLLELEDYPRESSKTYSPSSGFGSQILNQTNEQNQR
eukprot:403353687